MSKKGRSFSRKFDTLAGIPILFALSGLGPGRNARLPERVTRAAFLRMDSPRDTVLAEAAAKAFKERYPGSRLVFFAGEENFEAASLLPSVDEVIKIYPENIRKSALIIKSAGVFDIWADLGPWSRFESIMTFFAKARFKTGFKTEGEHRHFVYDRVWEFPKAKHLCENMAGLMKQAGVGAAGLPRLAAPGTGEKDLIVFNMFPDKPEQDARRWNEENWKYLLSRFTKKGCRIALTGGKANSEEADKFTESAGSDSDIDYLVGRLDGAGLLNALSKASLVISVDAWPLHAAAAMDVPVLGIYGPTSPEMYAPKGKFAYYVKTGAVCAGCQDIYAGEACPVGEPLCMDTIDRGVVEAEAFRILEGRR